MQKCKDRPKTIWSIVVNYRKLSENLLSLLQPQACNFIKKETLAQVFSCEFCEIFKNTFFTEHLRWLLLSFLDLNFSEVDEWSFSWIF